jgi:hypothetical protein
MRITPGSRAASLGAATVAAGRTSRRSNLLRTQLFLGYGLGKSAFVRHDYERLNLRHWVNLGRSLLVPAAVVVLVGAAHAQNLDQGKPAAKLFAGSCAGRHHSARGLAKGRFNLALFWFLQYYTSGASSAWTLTSYLESVDGAQQNRARAAATKSSRRSSPTSPLPSAPIAGR